MLATDLKTKIECIERHLSQAKGRKRHRENQLLGLGNDIRLLEQELADALTEQQRAEEWFKNAAEQVNEYGECQG